jgi:hypothetical protein
VLDFFLPIVIEHPPKFGAGCALDTLAVPVNGFDFFLEAGECAMKVASPRV